MTGVKSNSSPQIAKAKRPMWVCPECGRCFVNRNQWHSCGAFSIESHFEGKRSAVRMLFNAFMAAAEECGPIKLAPTKTRIGLQARMIFSAVMVRKEWLSVHIVLKRRLEDPRFTRIETLSPTDHIHYFKIRSLKDIDDELRSWLQEAYKVGTQDFIT